MLKIAVCQLNSTDDIAANLRGVRDIVREAARRGAHVVCLPENFAFMGGSDEDRRDAAEALAGDGPILSTLRELARAHSVHLFAGGMPEKSADPLRPYNAHVHVGPTGELLAVYRKMHLFDVDVGDGQTYRESHAVTPGHDVVVSHVGSTAFGLSICYDLRFPELYRALVDRGATVLLVPAAFTLMTGKDHWHTLLRARAIENQAYVVAAAQWGSHPNGRQTFGKALVVDPWGDVIAQASEGVGLILTEIDVDRADMLRRRMPCLKHRKFRVSAG